MAPGLLTNYWFLDFDQSATAPPPPPHEMITDMITERCEDQIPDKMILLLKTDVKIWYYIMFIRSPFESSLLQVVTVRKCAEWLFQNFV